MTAVIGILSKEGVALSADSAVTRSKHGNSTKVTSNGNKMIRLVENDYATIGVMVTGNGDYMLTPWDIIIRRFRKEKGLYCPRTVEEVVSGILDYIRGKDAFCDVVASTDFIDSSSLSIYNSLCQEYQEDPRSLKSYVLYEIEHNLMTVDMSILSDERRNLLYDRCKGEIEMQLTALTGKQTAVDIELLKLKEEFIWLVFSSMISQTGSVRDYSELIFCGFGADEKYPSLISLIIYGGLPNWVNYSHRVAVNISEDNPVAICPFAQTDISDAVLCGIRIIWRDVFISSYESKIHNLFSTRQKLLLEQGVSKQVIAETMKEILKRSQRCFVEVQEEYMKRWKDCVLKSSLPEMAKLAKHLIELTWFNKVLTFEVEDVGGELDLATISSKDRKFEWIQRKSWYHHKDVNGKYGRNGV